MSAYQWGHLELRKASNLRKEVDEALSGFASAVEGEDENAVEWYCGAFEARVEALEEFYLEHEDDERAILFEKQRMRLRRALASARTPASPPTFLLFRAAEKEKEKTVVSPRAQARPSAPPPGSASASTAGDPPAPNGPPPAPETPAAAADFPATPVAPPAPPPWAAAAAARTPATARSDADGGRVGGAASPKKKAPPTPKPLYSWETRDAPGAARRDVVRTAAATYDATDVDGVYGTAGARPPSRAFVDLQIVLNDAEREELGNLKRAAAAKAKKEARLDIKNKSEAFINSALPYVDAHRVEASLYRAAPKDAARWNY